MEKLRAYYDDLLKDYTTVIQELETEHKEFLKQHPNAPGVPHLAFNVRFFDTDELARLQNAMGSAYYSGRHRLKEKFYLFLAEYEKSSEEVRKKFEQQKEKGTYQGYLDLLYLPQPKPQFQIASKTYEGKIPFIPFLEKELTNLRFLESRLKQPYPPRSRNFNRQQSKYVEDKRKYDEDSESLDRRIREVIELIEKYKGLLGS